MLNPVSPPSPIIPCRPLPMAPVLSDLSRPVRYQRRGCSNILPRHDDTLRGQTDRTLCPGCHRASRITIRIPPRNGPSLTIPAHKRCPSCSEIRLATAFAENSTVCRTCETEKKCKECKGFFPLRKFWDADDQPTYDSCYRCRTRRRCTVCPKAKKTAQKLAKFLPLQMITSHPNHT
jgi:hypothetical protein